MIKDEHLNLLEKVTQLITNYGFWKILQALIVIAVFIIVSYSAINLGPIMKTMLDIHDTEKTELHDVALEKRRAIQPQISEMLSDALVKLNADRVWVIEFHNGTNNASGLPFNYGNMTYEKVAADITYVADDYNDVSLSRFTFPLYMEENHSWYGTIDELAELDDRLAKRMSSNDVTYLAMVQLNGVRTEIGYVGVTYCNGKEPASYEKISDTLMRLSQKLAILLDVDPSVAEQ